ncbi:MAG: hypothetical protein OIF57_05470 [Marinobacterium sp.]|nr:hypothetical protein [Marinobacterium sp.]
MITYIALTLLAIAYALLRQYAALRARDSLISYIEDLADNDANIELCRFAEESAKDSMDRLLMAKIALSNIGKKKQRVQVREALSSLSDKDQHCIMEIVQKMLLVNFKLAPGTFLLVILLSIFFALASYSLSLILATGFLLTGRKRRLPRSPMSTMRERFYRRATDFSSNHAGA